MEHAASAVGASAIGVDDEYGKRGVIHHDAMSSEMRNHILPEDVTTAVVRV